ncbi:strawberry notch-like NTP hydrolase domain-containing protein [Dawidia soli]|uniref:Strawberry notch family protein n=1 Tax=Dawidia soli TaxID=2782352 RepID=A0AAP2DD12_9BACT|nr:strawberry notch family protein [Dawidia soli]MBT1688901.1 strawberry notch family protein [Dawidia soli]
MISVVDNQELFISRVAGDLAGHVKHTKLTLEKLALQFNIANKTAVKELTEAALIRAARQITVTSLEIATKYQKIVELYNAQPNLSHRTSHSVSLQQYSTPAPIAYLAGLYVNADEDISIFEPSAGNGLLTIAANPANVTVNEIDTVRLANLRREAYRQVLMQDGARPFIMLRNHFDAVLTNPPFGEIPKLKFDGFTIGALEHHMALIALQTMRDEGKAAIIIGGHNRFDKKGRLQQGPNRFFMNYLYSHYHVDDVVNINGRKLYARQGTGVRIRLILIAGRKGIPEGAAPLADVSRDQVIETFEALFERIIPHVRPRNQVKMKRVVELEAEALELELTLLDANEELGMPYNPASDACVVLDTVIPDSMGYEAHTAVYRLKEEVGGDIDEYVRGKLGYDTKYELCQALSAEQIDAVALAVHNIEQGGGMIIGDQTGIGKGRIASAVIRYGVLRGKRPVFLTEKANLFSDIYRDLAAIGSAHLVPFIVNNRESKTDIKDEDGQIIFQAPPTSEQERIFREKLLPANYDFILATYSQFNSPEKKPIKPGFLQSVAKDTVMILDEAHNASGASNVGSLLQSVISKAAGVLFLSATFAKRPDNMPIYAMKTAIQEASMTRDELVEAINHGGVALQEVLSSQLVAEGQMLRRERSFEGVEVNYITLYDKEQEHKAIADNITSILRDIIDFQRHYINPEVERLDHILAPEGKQSTLTEGTSQAGVDNQPFVSKVFNVINQMLFSIKAGSVADRAIARLKEGKKPVIAFASTMGSFVEQMETDHGQPVSDGDTLDADFAEVLQRGLDGVLRYTETDAAGDREHKVFDITEFSSQAQAEYHRIRKHIKSVSTGITISPIDVVIAKIEEAGYSVAEVTGRKFTLQLNKKGSKALVLARKKINTNDAFRQFNNNEVDVLMINQSGSTGASAHAIVTNKVPKEQVKQRVMIVLQAELDINTEVQKRGRVNRTGQIIKPIYDYVNSAIPAEMRLMMMLQKKLKSLDANTTSNQKSSTKILDVPDFLNKYGDRVVTEYLRENQDVNRRLNDPLSLSTRQPEEYVEDAAHKVSGRVAVLSTKMQHDFYTEISTRYNELIEYLKQVDEYDLEVEAMDLATETLKSSVIKMGKGGRSQFGDDSILETVMANVLRKPFTAPELKNLLTESLDARDAIVIQTQIKDEFETYLSNALNQELAENKKKYERLRETDLKKDDQTLVDAAVNDAVKTALGVVDQNDKFTSLEALAKDRITEIYRARKTYMLNLLNFFHIGRELYYPIVTFDGAQELIYSVFLGFVIDEKRKNPYAPSAIRLRFAISNSSKYIAMPASYTKDVTAIIGASMSLDKTANIETVLNKWEEAIKTSAADRKVRYIITGNLLQAYGSFNGKLVSYTTADGNIKKGILMPESWNPKEEKNQKVIVPIARSINLIRAIPIGRQLLTNVGVSFFRQADRYKIIVAASRAKGGDLYLHPGILNLVDGGNFEKTGNSMAAAVSVNQIDEFVSILQKDFNDTVSLTPEQFALIQKELPAKAPRKTVNMNLPPPRERVPPPPPLTLPSPPSELELEAIALELELELLEL